MEIRDNYSAIAEANKQRRKLQNRKNQRARRQRIKGKVFEVDQASDLFEVRRWRVDEVDEVDDDSLQDKNTGSIIVSTNCHASYTPPFTTESATAVQAPSSTDQSSQIITIHSTSQPISITFPLPSDQLLHLIQFNIYRAFISIN